jgi:hypothetical protein
MKAFIILLLVVCYVVALPNREARKLRPVKCPGCSDDDELPEDECDCDITCHDPCDDCEEPRFYNKTTTPVINQEVMEHTILECAPGSYFQRIEYIGCYEWPTTCTGVLVLNDEDVEDVYTGVRIEGKEEKRHTLDAKRYKAVVSFDNGNAIQTETAKIERHEKCSGDILRSNSNYDAIDRLTGCCGVGVNQIQAKSFQLNIYGECCSECYLVQSSISYDRVVKNNR